MSTSRQPLPASSAAIAISYRSLVDDAAIFPPGNMPLARAVREHRAHGRSAYADLVGGFLVSDVALPDLVRQLGQESSASLAVTVVVTGGAGALEPAVLWAQRSDQLELRSVEIALRDEDNLAHNARRVTTAVDQLVASGHLDEDTPVFVEPPPLSGYSPSHSWLAALDEIAAMDLRLKFRTGGDHGDDFPSATDLASCIESALDRELAFKCTAGLHRAVRYRDGETGFEHHGFLNVLLATRASLDSTGPREVASLLDEQDPSTVVRLLDETGAPGLDSGRRWFTAFGSCSVREPLVDLVALGLVPPQLLEST